MVSHIEICNKNNDLKTLNMHIVQSYLIICWPLEGYFGLMALVKSRGKEFGEITWCCWHRANRQIEVTCCDNAEQSPENTPVYHSRIPPATVAGVL